MYSVALRYHRVLFTVIAIASLPWLAQAGLIQTIDYETGDLTQVYTDKDGPTASVSASTNFARAGSYSLRAYVESSDRRAETVNKYKRGTVGGVNWYGWSVYLPSNYAGDGRFDIVSQFHDYHGGQPSWSQDGKAPTSIVVKNGIFQLDLKYQDAPQSVAHQPFTLGSYSTGTWHDIVVHVKWTHNSDGFMKVWFNGDEVVDYQGRTYMDYGSGNGPYFKMGNYKGSSNWPGTSPRIIYVDEFRMGNSSSYYEEVHPVGDSPNPAATEVIIDNTDSAASFIGSWPMSTWSGGGAYYGSNYQHDGDSGKGSKTALYELDLPESGMYDVFLRWTSDSTRASNVPVDISSNSGVDLVQMDMTTGGGQWNLLGNYPFDAGLSGSIEISNTGTNGYVIADAVRLVKTGELSGGGPTAEIIVDNTDSGAVFNGSWSTSTWTGGGSFYGSNYRHDNDADKGNRTVTFTPSLPDAGQYEVYLRWTSASTRSSAVPLDITYDGGTDYVNVDMTTGGGQWQLLGTYDFTAGTSGNVYISNAGTSGIVVADAVRFQGTGSGGGVAPGTTVEIDNTDSSGVQINGSWSTSSSVSGHIGTNYLHDGNSGKGIKSVVYTPNLPGAASYEVFIRYASNGTNRASNVPVDISHASGTSGVTVDQTTGGGTWVSLGTYAFNGGSSGTVIISNTGTTDFVVADAVRFVAQ